MRFTDGYRFARRVSQVFGLAMRPALFKRAIAHAARMQQAQEDLLAHYRRIATQVSRDLTAQLQRDMAYSGEAYVHVGFDLETQLPTVERVDPSEIEPSLTYEDGRGGKGLFQPTPAQWRAISDGATRGVSLDGPEVEPQPGYPGGADRSFWRP